jgi:hypothetical protein
MGLLRATRNYFLNDGTEVIAPDRIEAMLQFLSSFYVPELRDQVRLSMGSRWDL